jgi:hypothetical protein
MNHFLHNLHQQLTKCMHNGPSHTTTPAWQAALMNLQDCCSNFNSAFAAAQNQEQAHILVHSTSVAVTTLLNQLHSRETIIRECISGTQYKELRRALLRLLAFLQHHYSA